MSASIRTRLALVLALALIAAAVGITAETQRSVAEHAFEEADSAQLRLIGMLDQEDGLQDALSRGGEDGEALVRSGRRIVAREFLRVELSGHGAGSDYGRALAREARTARRWELVADAALSRRDASPRAGEERDELLDAYRDASAATGRILEKERTARERHATIVSAGMLGVLALLLGLPAYLYADRQARRSARRGGERQRFGEAMQFARTQDDSYEVLRRHLDITLVGARSIVLNRNNSADRLESRTPIPAGSSLTTTLDGAAPDACLAIRRGRTHRRRAGEAELMSCDVCGAQGENVTCTPSLVGGEVIGSVLVEHARRPSAGDEEHLETSVAEAAPIVANLRNLEMAETRAMTDMLTGLPNKRALDQSLKRMVAQAGRNGSELAAVLFDLDRFKQINDRLGHEAGDEVLAAVGAVIPESIRASDISGRFGGEEFLLLLPDTSRDGAFHAAEKLRLAIAEIELEGERGLVTASFGVASMPEDAQAGTELLRVADRALYVAKANGRNRVELGRRHAVSEDAVVPAAI